MVTHELSKHTSRRPEMSGALVDRFGRIQDYLRISVTDRCNLRCTYCMPAEGVVWKRRSDLLTDAEIVRVGKVMASLGVRKIRLTGGEPTTRTGLAGLVAQLHSIDGIETVSLTTNGVLFARFAEDLKAAGLYGVNISLDSLDRENFIRIARRDALQHVLSSVHAALECGFAAVKINVVVMAGVNEHELLDFVELAKDNPLNVRFIEYMPFKGNRWEGSGIVSYDDMRSKIEQMYPLHALPETFTTNRIAEDFTIPGFRGRISIIASMTRSFCAACSRLRLTSDGALKACLFYPAQGQLRTLMRSDADDEELKRAIRQVVGQKPEGHPEPERLEALNDLSMIEIGG